MVYSVGGSPTCGSSPSLQDQRLKRPFSGPPIILWVALLLVLGIVCMAFASPALLAGTHWFLFVVVTSFIATLIWISIYFLSIREALTLPINWILTELLNTCVISVLYLTAFIIQLYTWSPNYRPEVRDPNIIAGVIGIINTMAYAGGAYFLYVEWKASLSTQ